jgi:hypothetical protein
MYTYKIIESTFTSQIFKDDLLIDEKTPWESAEAAQNWANLIVSELNNGINENVFIPKEVDSGDN